MRNRLLVPVSVVLLLTACAEAPVPAEDTPEVASAAARLAAPETKAALDAALGRAKAHRATVEAALDRHGVPRLFAAVPIVESRYENLGAAGGAIGDDGLPIAPGQRGAGIWMFIPETARAYGLRVDAGGDDRLDEARETEAAARLFADLLAEFHDVPLALAAYNEGPERVRAAIAREGTRDAFALMRRAAIHSYAADVLAAARLLDAPDR